MRLDSSPGLADVLLEQAEPGEVVQETVVENLFAVTAGRAVSHPARTVREVNPCRTLLELWREQFDYVIIDSPPVLAVADTAIIARSSDAVLFTTRIVKNGRRTVERAKTLLDNQSHHHPR